MKRFLSFTVFMFLFSFSGASNGEESVDDKDENRAKKSETENSTDADKDYFKRAIDLFKNGDFTKAAAFFRLAYQARQNYRILHNIALAEMSASRFGLALEAFQEYLEAGGEEISKEKKGQALDDIQTLQQLVGTVTVDAVAECSVRIDDVERGTIPLPKELAVKAKHEHTVDILCEEKKAYTEKLTVEVGQSIHIDATEETERFIRAGPGLVIQIRDMCLYMEKLALGRLGEMAVLASASGQTSRVTL